MLYLLQMVDTVVGKRAGLCLDIIRKAHAHLAALPEAAYHHRGLSSFTGKPFRHTFSAVLTPILVNTGSFCSIVQALQSYLYTIPDSVNSQNVCAFLTVLQYPALSPRKSKR